MSSSRPNGTTAKNGDVVCDRASPADRPPIVALLRSCSLPVEDLPSDLGDFFTATQGSELVGTIGLEMFGPTALLRSLAVAPGWRGRGLAESLWERARAHALASGVQEVFLLTTTAEPIFARWGFQRTSRDVAPPAIQNTSEFTTLCPASAAFMRWAPG
jgi:amino-acid N-acetyltransferase